MFRNWFNGSCLLTMRGVILKITKLTKNYNTKVDYFVRLTFTSFIPTFGCMFLITWSTSVLYICPWLSSLGLDTDGYHPCKSLEVFHKRSEAFCKLKYVGLSKRKSKPGRLGGLYPPHLPQDVADSVASYQ